MGCFSAERCPAWSVCATGATAASVPGEGEGSWGSDPHAREVVLRLPCLHPCWLSCEESSFLQKSVTSSAALGHLPPWCVTLGFWIECG